jgi:GR25 family glycosyltransferase involved in LPS biosynthesis
MAAPRPFVGEPDIPGAAACGSVGGMLAGSILQAGSTGAVFSPAGRVPGESGPANGAAQPAARPDLPKLGIFAVNLDRSPDRWAMIQRHFGHLPWPLYRTRALDARRDPGAVLAMRGQELALPPEGVGWNPYRFRVFSLVEEACLAGHMLAWRQFLQSGHERGLILEDDAEPFGDFEGVVRALLEDGPAIDVVKLEGTPARASGRLAIPVRPLGKAHQLVRSLRPRSGGAAYVLTRSAAEQLLQRIDKVMMPVDDFLWSSGLHGLDVTHVSPWLVMQSGIVSTMVPDRAPHRHVKRRDPAHLLLQVGRRFFSRWRLWWSALHGRPWAILAARPAPWLPQDYPKTRNAASAAKG